jgi:hypothetical protein
LNRVRDVTKGVVEIVKREDSCFLGKLKIANHNLKEEPFGPSI